jgi:DNA polymerase I-like protein with 3'-5' exonuclease and polymerase domains
MISMHDEVAYSVAPEHVEDFKEVLYYSLEKADKYFKVKCPNDIEVKSGENWFQTH